MLAEAASRGDAVTELAEVRGREAVLEEASQHRGHCTGQQSQPSQATMSQPDTDKNTFFLFACMTPSPS